MKRTALSHQAYQRCQERPFLVVEATDQAYGFGCRACNKELPPRFAALYVATSTTPGVSGQLHFVCKAECGRRLLSEFAQIGVKTENWSAPRLREWLNHDELVAGVIGVRGFSAGDSLMIEFSESGE